jgi:arylsulfatase A-like enzyme
MLSNMNIVLVLSDTLRRDYLPCYGNTTIIAPNVAAFARRSLVFDNFHAASFPTVPARADLMTGKYTFSYLDWGPLPQDEITLAETLSKAGLLTVGIADTPFLTRNGYGYDRGFQDFISIRGQRSGPEHDDVISLRQREEDYFAPQTFKTAIEWLERHHRQQFFLYIDTWDPHEPWDPPEYYVRPYYPAYAGENITPNYWYWKEDGYTEKDLEIARACYCGEISMVDRWFGLFINRLESLGLMENTVVLFTTDHGFYFGEHDQFGKKKFRWPGDLRFEEGFLKGYKVGDQFSYRSALHRELGHIPLLVYIPGAGHTRVPGLASIPDLTPTILELAQAPIPASVQAKSLLPLIERRENSIHDFVVTSSPLETIGDYQKVVDDQPRKVIELSPSTIITADWDMFYAARGDPVELYDARKDPRHLSDLASKNNGVVRKLHADFIHWLQAMGTPAPRLAPRLEL